MKRIPIFALAIGIALAGLAPPAQARQSGIPPSFNPPPLNEKATRVLVHCYRSTDYWAIKALVLMSLGSHWHPSGGEIVLDALRAKDKRLKAFGIEALRRTGNRVLNAVASKEMIDELIFRQTKVRNRQYRAQVEAVIRNLVPRPLIRDPRKWTSWWTTNRRVYQSATWPEPEGVDTASGTRAPPFFKQLFDLSAEGMDLVIIIDSTGSMQPVIDAARDAVDDLVSVLEGITKRLRIGVVHYRDYEDMNGGAKKLSSLTTNTRGIRDLLENLQARGGGDYQERVEKGLEIALRGSMNWNSRASKVIVILGDAPPHKEDQARAEELARLGFTNPAKAMNRVHTPSKDEIPPIITCAITFGYQAEKAFGSITTAGGGHCVRIDRSLTDETDRNLASQAVVRYILGLSFGVQWRSRMDAFFYTYLFYKECGFY